MRFFLTISLLSMFCGFGSAEQLWSENFDDLSAGKLPPGFRTFTRGTEPNVEVVEIEGGKALLGRRSPAPQLVALVKDFDAPQKRVLIEFDLAVSESKGRAFHIWTFEPGGKDASQLNLSVQRGTLRQYSEGGWIDAGVKIVKSTSREKPVWQRIQVLLDAESDSVNFGSAVPGGEGLPHSRMAYRSELPIGGIGFVSGSRIADDAWYLVDNISVQTGVDLPEPAKAKPLPEVYPLWTGEKLPTDPEQMPFATGLEHRIIHRAEQGKYQFLHGASIVKYKDTFFANWANSPVHENGPHETLQGRRSFDGGKTWPHLEMVGPGFDGSDRHSHGVLFAHGDELWTICAFWNR
ncbi:MAG: hypothetical protein P1V20_19360 [Verrucomicrobiales bacterium]|nr:hypothetical protein [Verrucomicrobiales bacterium]